MVQLPVSDDDSSVPWSFSTHSSNLEYENGCRPFGKNFFHPKSKSSLLGGLYGISLGHDESETPKALLITQRYDTATTQLNVTHPIEQAERPDNVPEPLRGDQDHVNMHSTLVKAGLEINDISEVSNDMANKENIETALSRVASNTAPTTIYLQGHGVYDSDNKTVEYVPCDYNKRQSARGISCNDIYKYLSPRQRNFPVQRLIITDFCFGYNFCALKYKLVCNYGQQPYWTISEEWKNLEEGSQYDTNDLVIHLAAGSHDEAVMENDKGGLFTQAACTVMSEQKSLPRLLEDTRRGVRRIHMESLETIHGRTAQVPSNQLHSRIQTPQIYCSHELNLEDAAVMQQFGWFRTTED